MGLPDGALQSLLNNAYSLYDLCAALARQYGFNTVGDTYLNFLFDTVFNWQQADQNSIGSFLSFWEKKSDKQSVITSNTDAVTIMTVHKSKGLEFPVVIYPYVNDNLDPIRGSSLWIAPQELGFPAIPHIEKVSFDLNSQSAIWTEQTQALYEEERMKVRLDNLNIRYVAFTRPKQRLYILSTQEADDGKRPLNGFLNLHREQWVQEEGEKHRILYRLGNPDTPKVEERERIPSIRNVYHESRSCEWFDKISIDPDPSMFWISRDDGMKPREWGDFVHQVLSEIHHESDLDHVLFPYLDAGVIDPAHARQLQERFSQLVHHPVLGPAFLPEAQVRNECEILTQSHRILRPDRFAELPDKIYLLDYKTGKPADEHHEQLQQYIAVLRKMVSKTIEAYLVYLGDDITVVPVDNTIN